MQLGYVILASLILWTQTKTSAHLEGGNIYCLPKAGSPVIRVSSHSGNVTGPAWNPDGSQILYVATGEDQEGHDYEKAWFTIVNLSDLATRNLQLPPGLIGVRSPALSPDGTRAAFVARSAATPEIAYTDLYITNLSDGTTVNFTKGSISFIGMPTWSPDGSRIAFTTGMEKDWSLHIMEVDDKTGKNREIRMGDAFILNLSWSPDGKRFALQRRVEENFEIFVMNADGSGLVNISNHPAFDGDPAWSPDGTEIIFVSDRDGDMEIYRMAADGSAVTQVTANEVTDMEPAWSSDGKICFISDREVHATEPVAP